MVCKCINPFYPRAADIFLKENRTTIINVAKDLIKQVNYLPRPFYRGLLLKHPIDCIKPHERLEYLSFSSDRSVAHHFANSRGFGSEIMNVAQRLGEHGYVIEYTPAIDEMLFHYEFLSLLPYSDEFTLLDMDGALEVNALKQQREIMILEPKQPFKNISKI